VSDRSNTIFESFFRAEETRTIQGTHPNGGCVARATHFCIIGLYPLKESSVGVESSISKTKYRICALDTDPVGVESSRYVMYRCLFRLV